MKLIKKALLIVVLTTISLTPLLWFYGKGNVLINGVDTNFPLDPLTWFLRRFYVWNNIINGGSNFSSSTAGLFFHSIQVVPFILGFNIQLVQIISLVFWFSAIVVSSFILARRILPDKQLLQILFVTLYAFNIYIFNTWENVKVANLSLVVALPLSVYTLLSVQRFNLSRFKVAILSVIVGIFLSGAGINPAYFISFFLGMGIIAFGEIMNDFQVKEIKRKLINLVLIFGIVILVNSFWIFPTSQYIFSNISANGSINDIGFTNWLDSLSENTSLSNIIRLLGAWDWYSLDSKTGLPLYIPYSLKYFKEPTFILFSFLLPFLLIGSFLLAQKKDRYIYTSFGILILVGFFLGAGTHAPTGVIYKFLSVHVPFFSLFRSPWYIFTPLVILSYAIFGALFLSNLDSKGKKSSFWNKWKLSQALTILIIVLNLVYCYPLVLGRIFRPGNYGSFYVQFPPYVFEAKKILDDGNGRLISYPDDELENFKWGYRGVESITQLFSNREMLFSTLNTANAPISKITKELYGNLKRGEVENAKLIAAKLQANGIFEKQDQGSLAPALLEDKYLLNNSSGPWKFYNFPPVPLPEIYPSSEIFVTDNYNSSMVKSLFVTPKESVVVNRQDRFLTENDFLGKSNEVIFADNSQTKDLDFFNKSKSKQSQSFYLRDLSKVNYFFNIEKDGEYRPYLERYKLEDFGFDLNKNLKASLDGIETSLPIEYVDDSKVLLKTMTFKKGSHSLEFKLQTKNLLGEEKLSGKEISNQKGVVEIKRDDNLGFEYMTLLNQSSSDIAIKIPVKDFDPFAIYLLQFKYKHLFGLKPHLMMEQSNDTSPIKHQMEVMPYATDWTDYSFYFTPVETKSSLKVDPYLTASDEPLGSKVSYANFNLKKVFLNNFILVSENNPLSFSSPEIHFNSKSPVNIVGNVKGGQKPHILVFTNNYSQDWQIALYNKGKKMLYIPDHFTCNFYANCWYLEGMPEDYKFEITYKPQQLYLMGIAVSVAGTGLVLLATYWWSKRYEKNI